MKYFNRIIFILIITLTLKVFAQNQHKVLFTSGNRRSFHGYIYDPVSNKTTKLVTNGFIMAVSPSGYTFIASHRNRRRQFETFIYNTSTGSKLKQQPLINKGYLWAQFLSEKEIIVLEHKRPGHRVNIYNIETGQIQVVINSKHSTWDDVPLALSPNKKYCVYYKRDKSGLYFLDIKNKNLTYLHSGTIIKWAPDSKHFLVFNKKKFRLELCKLDNGKVSTLKDFGARSIMGYWLTSMDDILIIHAKKRRQGTVTRYYGKSKSLFIKEILVRGIVLNRFVDFENKTGEIVWLEMNNRRMSLQIGQIDKGVLKNKKTIQTKTIVIMPFLISPNLKIQIKEINKKPENPIMHFWNILSSAEVEELKACYADEIILKAGSEFLKKSWGINSSGDRSKDTKIKKEDIIKAYRKMLQVVGEGKWTRLFSRIPEHKINIQTLPNGNKMLKVFTGPGDDFIEFEFAYNKDKAKWLIISEYTDY